MEPDVSPGFRRREEDGRAGGRDRFDEPVERGGVQVQTPADSEDEDVPDDGGDDGADDGQGGVETRRRTGLALERGLSGRAVDCMSEGSALFVHTW